MEDYDVTFESGPSDKCPYLTSGEDHHQTTIFPTCSCGYAHCGEYRGYCPVRDS